MQNFNVISIIICFDLVRFLSLEKGISYLIHFNVTLLVLLIEGSSKHSFFGLQYIQAPEAKQSYELVFDL